MYIAPKGKTHNLLDYTTNATATNLRKYQWDYIHNPENIVGIFEDDSEGEAFRQKGTDMQAICDPFLLNKINERKIFYTPDLQKIDLGKLQNARANKFYTLQDTTISARGTVNGFIKDGKQYVMLYGENTLKVKRFEHSEGDEIPIEDILYTGEETPQIVNIDCENGEIWLDDSTEKYGFECSECEYSDVPCADLLVKYKDSPLLKSDFFRRAILENPCLLEKGGLTIHFPDNLLPQEESDLSKFTAIAIGGTLLSTVGAITLFEAILEPMVDAAVIVANSSGTELAVNALVEEVSLFSQFVQKTYLWFTLGTASSYGTQLYSNYAFYGNWSESFGKVDLVDAVADGSLFAVTMGISSGANLLVNGKQVVIYKNIVNTQNAYVFTIEFVKATFDYQLESSELKSVFNNKKSDYEVFCNFLFSMVGSKLTNGLQNTLIKWSNTDILNTKAYKALSSEEKRLANKINTIVKSEGFKNAINVETSALNKFIQDFASKEIKFYFKKDSIEEVSVTLEEYIQKQMNMPVDNTNINNFIVKP